MIKIGDLLFSDSLKEFKVSKIGNKYFECENFRGKFLISELSYHEPNYSQRRFRLYKTRKEVEDINHRRDLEGKFYSLVPRYGKLELSNEDLKIIIDILEKYKK